MRVDYDLVVIGNGANAREIASRASSLKARVALVTETEVWDRVRIEQIILKLRHFSSQENFQKQNPSEIIVRAVNSLPIQEEQQLLQVWGVDLILGKGEFSDRYTFKINNRLLTSRRFVIVDQTLQNHHQTGITSFLQSVYDGSEIPESLIIIGGDDLSCAIAQILNHLNIKITLVTQTSHILPNVDVEIARIFQAKLESEGIQIYTSSQIERVHDQIFVNFAPHGTKISQVLTESQILISHDQRTPSFLDLNLAKAGVKLSENRIKINAKLQSTNPRIYVSSSNGDINTILANALFFPRTQTKFATTCVCYTQPAVAYIGLTEIAARLKYGKDLYVLQVNQDDQIGMCKLLCRGNGEIIGAHIIGANAPELIETIAIAMNANLKIPQLAEYSDQLISQIAKQLDLIKLGRDRQLRRQSWFEWLRLFNL